MLSYQDPSRYLMMDRSCGTYGSRLLRLGQDFTSKWSDFKRLKDDQRRLLVDSMDCLLHSFNKFLVLYIRPTSMEGRVITRGLEGIDALGTWLVDQMTAPSVAVTKVWVLDIIGLLQRAEHYIFRLGHCAPSFKGTPRKHIKQLEHASKSNLAISPSKDDNSDTIKTPIIALLKLLLAPKEVMPNGMLITWVGCAFGPRKTTYSIVVGYGRCYVS